MAAHAQLKQQEWATSRWWQGCWMRDTGETTALLHFFYPSWSRPSLSLDLTSMDQTLRWYWHAHMHMSILGNGFRSVTDIAWLPCSSPSPHLCFGSVSCKANASDIAIKAPHSNIFTQWVLLCPVHADIPTARTYNSTMKGLETSNQ